MGWERGHADGYHCKQHVAIRFRWIWVGRALEDKIIDDIDKGRNPLSLDMGWES